MISSIVNIGIHKGMKGQLKQQVTLTNKLLLILIMVDLLLLFPIVFEDGWAIGAYIALASLLVLAGLIGLNYFGYYTASRVGTSLYPSFIVMVAAILIKQSNFDNVRVYDFFDARILIAGFFILPFILFSLKEKIQLFLTISIIFALVVAFDPIHVLFGVGYEHYFGPMARAYIVSGIYMDIVLLFVGGSLIYFKSGVEKLFHKNFVLARDLGDKNIELSALFQELEESHEVLQKNEVVIKDQKSWLEKSNFELVEKLEKKTKELRQSNKELIRHNNELEQFSNTLSHNLRGPVANLLGLSNLFKIDNSEANRMNVADHIYKSAEALDGVIKDLNKIVELRNNLHQIKEKIEIKEEIDGIWLILEPNIKQCNGKLLLDIEAPLIYGVRSYFYSVIYNLISNAIKYRHQDRDCLIRIKTSLTESEFIIIIQDNGIGIDLKKHGDKMFGMYKRFHTHLEGKGLGLFLAKQQVEAMGGSISVESELNVGTRFIIKLPNVELSSIESQLFYKSKVADIYLDAINHITTLVWKQTPNPTEFKEVFTNNIEVFSSYDSDKWIIDLTLLVNMSPLRKKWVLNNAIEQYINVDIRKIAVVRTLSEKDTEFWHEFKTITSQKRLEVIFVNSTKEAKENLLKDTSIN